MEFYQYITNSVKNIESPVFPDRFYRLTDGAILGMRFYPPEIINPEKGFTETDAINIEDSTNFINAAKPQIDILTSASQNLISVCQFYAGTSMYIDNMKNSTSNIVSTALVEFQRHTDRLTGQIEIGTELPIDIEPDETRDVPYLVILDSIGKNYSYFKYVETGVIDESILNSAYGSIFVDFQEHANTLNTISQQIIANCVLNIEPTPPYIFNMDPQYASDLDNTIIEIYNTINTIRRADETVYSNILESFKTDKAGNNIMILISDIQKEMLDFFQSNVNI